ncbi:MAG: DNA recombination protein RmuC [Actinobacteria bacterium]|nr:DNA recombination protein RmuC [Actinomycetota bacterium]MSX24965.1 DNA recombination protein RmuC [Actinomycetota bacterium]MSY46419.1 DNA recombination protein RmuC [Actinomycetota bacterium]MSY57333.1 DNA recombination protein RmuC [Actinomycetota bacterium]MTB00894.1 DNA recombination protein RmuC [Actinomycetota bacterium]
MSIAIATFFLGIAAGVLFSKNRGAGAVEALEKQIASMQKAQTETTRVATELEAMKKSVESLSTQAREADRSRIAAEEGIRKDLTNMAQANKSLLDETTKIAGALTSSQKRGKFGEAQLEMLLETSGLIEGEHFTRQKSFKTDDEKTGIPDITISMPGSSMLFIDSKFPFDRILEAYETSDPDKREELMTQHADDLRKHIDALAKRGYADKDSSPNFVVLFAPFESILTEALRVNSNLLNYAFVKGVTIATPTTMMALLRTVGYIFSRNRLAESATEIQELAGTFLKNVAALHTKIVTVGDRLKSTLKAYNEMIPTAESTVLSPAKKILNLGVSGDASKLKAFPEVSENVRQLKSNLALDAPEDFIDAEEVDEEN